jgi:L-amino acid N-acyltransferase YncA
MPSCPRPGVRLQECKAERITHAMYDSAIVKIATMGSQIVKIRAVELSDADTLAEIYNHYVLGTVVTFEEDPISGGEMEQRIGAVRSATLPWLVAEKDGRAVGYASASPWKARSAYRFSVEVTVYVAQDSARNGIGSMLYGELLSILHRLGAHAVIGGIALPNDASVALHEKFGFKKVAHFQEVGSKFNQWIDVGYWERVL